MSNKSRGTTNKKKNTRKSTGDYTSEQVQVKNEIETDTSTSNGSGKKTQQPNKNNASKEKVTNGKDKVVKIKVSEQDESEPFSNFRISEKTVEVLEENGYKNLFPIQAKTFDLVYDGRDLIGRARTGTGKTLSFSLPLIEKMLLEGVSTERGRGPKMIVLAPTRELSQQVERVIKSIGQKLKSVCIYGGVQYSGQERAFLAGVDIVVGTTGRIVDFLDQGKLKLKNVKYFVCDEADEMLNMGFREDVEKIIEAIPKENNVQMLLYSATIPDWVKTLAKRFLKNHIVVDLVGSTNNTQTAVNIRHLAIETTRSTRLQGLSDIVKVYSRLGKVILFCETKAEANEVGLSSSISTQCQVIHGDISQQQREITLASFREGKFKVLVATDVAARGLDIEGVDLVIQLAPPKDYEQYIHRSGRTGRAGAQGTSVTLFQYWEASTLKMIERAAKITFTRIGMPQPVDIYKAGSEDTVERLLNVSEEMIPHTLPFAQEAIEKFGGDAERALAAAIAALSGFDKPVLKRSLLTNLEGHTTVKLDINMGEPIRSKYFVISLIQQDLRDDSVSQQIKTIKLTTEGGAVVDVPEELANRIMKAASTRTKSKFSWSVPSELPELAEEETTRRGSKRSFSDGGGKGGGRYQRDNKRRRRW